MKTQPGNDQVKADCGKVNNRYLYLERISPQNGYRKRIIEALNLSLPKTTLNSKEYRMLLSHSETFQFKSNLAVDEDNFTCIWVCFEKIFLKILYLFKTHKWIKQKAQGDKIAGWKHSKVPCILRKSSPWTCKPLLINDKDMRQKTENHHYSKRWCKSRQLHDLV